MKNESGFEIVNFDYEQKEFNFAVNSSVDHIQNFISTGQFYEIEELQIILKHCNNIENVLDVGANIGNHSVFLSHFLNPKKLYMIEPNPIVIPLLKANLGLNWHPSLDLSYIGCGLGDQKHQARVGPIAEANLGGTRLLSDENGSVTVYPADMLFPETKFDFVKIDAEGMEINVLKGMVNILERGVSILFVEVLLTHRSEVIHMLEEQGYTFIDEYQRYEKCTNVIFRV